MRRLVVLLVCSVLVLAACGSSGKEKTTGATAPVSTSTPSTTSRPATSTSRATTTTTAACPNTGPTGPRTTPGASPAALLTKVSVTSAGCNDRVEFDFKAGGGEPPSCKISYRAGPFTQDASGEPVTVPGSAFVVVRCFPAYTYDFETGDTTYTGPKRIDPTGTHHVRAVVETGDFEGVLTWVIGLDAQRAFEISSMGTPSRLLIVTFS
jgi:hypothetical protein